ncbi:hypothetical protein [Nocardia cyriacigeorgica]|uniref:hypothetical protein n=1 Tax=Nocardia cyriacigeorgica TaxID=135487 RepID=UPI001E37AD50|nr:hypothetical protein [Nocardia cyriacigeorgica]
MSTQHWVAGFRAPLVNPAEQIRLAEPRELAGQTLRQVVRLAGGGRQLRVRLTNRYSDRELIIGAAAVAHRKAGYEIVPETAAEVRFVGSGRVRVPAFGEVVSDPIDLPVAAGTHLVLSLYLPEPTGPAAFAHMPVDTAWIVPGDQVTAQELSDAEESTSRFFLTGWTCSPKMRPRCWSPSETPGSRASAPPTARTGARSTGSTSGYTAVGR